jgi:hypothetical protein
MNGAAQAARHDPWGRFAKTLAAKDVEAVRAVTTQDVNFRAMTPGRFWEANTHAELAEVLFGSWLEPTDEVMALLSTSTGEVSTRHHGRLPPTRTQRGRRRDDGTTDVLQRHGRQDQLGTRNVLRLRPRVTANPGFPACRSCVLCDLVR